jgi:SH3 domain protein
VLAIEFLYISSTFAFYQEDCMRKGLLASILWTLVLPALCGAETMYITDRVEASLRSGKGLAAGSQYLGVVRTGDKVEVLSTDGEYARVVAASGTEGWLHTRYLSATQPADNEKYREKIKALQDELTSLKEEKTGLEALRDQQVAKIREADTAYENLKAGCTEYTKGRSEIDKAQKELQINNEVMAQLKRENEELMQNTQLMWFIFGSAAVLCGFIIGMWLQSLRKRRKSKFSF